MSTVHLNGHDVECGTLKELIRARAALGAKVFASIEGAELSYAQADERANRIANSLRGLGVEQGDVVATYMVNSTDHICAWFACAKLGAIWAPLNIALINLDLAYTLRNAGPRVLIADAKLMDNVRAVELDPALRVVVRGERSFDELLSGSSLEPDAEIAASDPAGLIYTGGSTGLPKGVLVSNLWYFTGFLRYGEMFDPTPADVHFGLGQMCHTIGSAVDVLTPFYFGMRTVLGRRF